MKNWDYVGTGSKIQSNNCTVNKNTQTKFKINKTIKIVKGAFASGGEKLCLNFGTAEPWGK